MVLLGGIPHSPLKGSGKRGRGGDSHSPDRIDLAHVWMDDAAVPGVAVIGVRVDPLVMAHDWERF